MLEGRQSPYLVSGPNALWHFVAHCGIDGYSSLIVFLQCSWQQCLIAVQQYGLPSQVRTDQLCKAVKIFKFPNIHVRTQRGTDRQSVLVGFSVHNHLWIIDV